jgi:response regulator NasT
MDDKHFRIALADDDPIDRRRVKRMLETLGHDVVAEAADGGELVEQVARTHPDLVLTDLNMPVVDGLQAADSIGATFATPVVVMSRSHTAATSRRLLAHTSVFGYLVKPFAAGMLDGILRFSIGLLRRFSTLQDQVNTLQRTLEDRKLVERAKGVLMKSLNLREPEAHRKLQKLASSRNLKLPELAESILNQEFPSGK